MGVKRFSKLAVATSLALLAACASNQNSSNASAALTPDTSEVPAQAKNNNASYINVQLGIGYLQHGNTQRAKAKLLSALEQDPNSPLANDAMAYYQEVTGNMALADSYYKKAMSLAPGKGAQLNNYGTFLCRQKKYKAAEKYFLAAVRDPSYVSAGEAYENAGLCAMAVPNVAKAKKYFQEALQKNPQLENSMLELAKINYKQKKFKTAESYLMTFERQGKPTAASSLLGFNLARKLRNNTQQARYAHLLQDKFASSPQYAQFRQQFSSSAIA